MRISVVIPAYNAARTVGRAIDSVLAQTRAADEIIVVDDGSTDGTAEVVGGYGEKVQLIVQDNAGVSVARNRGIEAATGEWIAFLDSDDEWLPEKLEYQADHLARHPDLVWTYTNLSWRKQDKVKLHPAHSATFPPDLLVEPEVLNDYLLAYAAGFFASTITLLIRRDILDKAGLFVPGMKRAQDTDLWFRIAYQFPKVGCIPRPLAVYHLDTPGSSTKINDEIDFMVRLIDRHMVLSKQFSRQEAFVPCVVVMLQTWIRGFLDQSRRSDARQLLNRFSTYLPGRFRREVRFRLVLPGVGDGVVGLVFRLKQCIRRHHKQ